MEEAGAGFSVSTWDLARQVLTKLTPTGDQAGFPLWTPDSRHVIYRSQSPDGTVKIMRVDASGAGAPETLVELGKTDANSGIPECVSADGKLLTLRMIPSGQQPDVMLFHLDGAEKKLQALLAGPANENSSAFSPDGKWLAYVFSDSTSAQVFLRPFPDVAANRWQASSGFAGDPAWSRSGREVFFLTNANRMVGVTLQPGGVLGREIELFDTTGYLPVLMTGQDYDTAPDGRFLMIKRRALETRANTTPTMTIVTHWIDEVKARVK